MSLATYRTVNAQIVVLRNAKRPTTLIQIRGKNKKIVPYGLACIGGRCEYSDVDSRHTAKREFYEETGWNIDIDRFYKFTESKTCDWFMVYFDETDDIVCHPKNCHELADASNLRKRVSPSPWFAPFGHCWVSLNELPHALNTWEYGYLLKLYERISMADSFRRRSIWYKENRGHYLLTISDKHLGTGIVIESNTRSFVQSSITNQRSVNTVGILSHLPQSIPYNKFEKPHHEYDGYVYQLMPPTKIYHPFKWILVDNPNEVGDCDMVWRLIHISQLKNIRHHDTKNDELRWTRLALI